MVRAAVVFPPVHHPARTSPTSDRWNMPDLPISLDTVLSNLEQWERALAECRALSRPVEFGLPRANAQNTPGPSDDPVCVNTQRTAVDVFKPDRRRQEVMPLSQRGRVPDGVYWVVGKHYAQFVSARGPLTFLSDVDEATASEVRQAIETERVKATGAQMEADRQQLLAEAHDRLRRAAMILAPAARDKGWDPQPFLDTCQNPSATDQSRVMDLLETISSLRS